MFEWIGDALMAVVGGGATGILGSAVQSYFQFKTKVLENEQENIRLAHDAKMVTIEADANLRIAQQEAAAQADNNAFIMQTASYEHDKRNYMPENGAPTWIVAALGIVDVIRGLVRPSLTIYVAVATTIILVEANGLIESVNGIGADVRLNAAMEIWRMVAYIATTIFFWWFGQRPPKKY
ncbi:hypothetical protein KUL42_09980 [Alteromonas sp. KUL42]|uniref:hypothetical protein n=1 Tax=Alteromonas sp. KUL42 TaxID=2480797 RepID=UPI001036C8FA|nr:hypothetical protein [Alteromonas sp. KUL42]TAP37787.1 hypothetical protein EYR97_04960 [Alteromonas sp. KUL42]GEA06237.1 hypothetical protein KUL42_09980 [Alteromonas sp. KUL42]